MPAISKIRFTNVIYEGGDKRYNDELFLFDGNNGAIVLENGGGKTVFIQTALQAVLPHAQVAGRKMKDTLQLTAGPAHIAIEWILNERPRRYALTCVTLHVAKNRLDSLKYVFEYEAGDSHSIENLPFVRGKRPAGVGEIQDYYSQMAGRHMNAHTFDTIERYKAYLEEHFHIVSTEWESIVKINSGEGDVERFFDQCNTTGQLIDRLLIPNIEDAMAGFEAGRFADNFESRLDSFRQYKQFQERIEEYRSIQQRVDELVRYFKRLDDRQEAYIANKGRAKAYYEESQRQHEQQLCKLEEAVSRLDALQEKEKVLQHRQLSLAFAKEQDKLKGLEEELYLLQRTTKFEKSRFEEAAEKLARLRLAEQFQRKSMAERRKARLQQELKEIDQNEAHSDVVERFEETKRELAGAFANRKAVLERDIGDLKVRLRQYNEKTREEYDILQAIQDKLDTVKLNEQGEKTSIEHLQNDMELIRKELLLENSDLPMEEHLKRWAEKQTGLDQKIIAAKNRNSELKALQKQTKEESERIQQSLTEIRSQLTAGKSLLTSMEQEEKTLIGHLQTSSKLWSNLTSVHDRQESIHHTLRDEIEQRQKRLEQLLIEERVATRFNDDYSNQTSFFADPFLFEQLQNLQSGFSYLKTGSEFLAASDQQNSGHAEYPFWSNALITTAKEAALLSEKLAGMRDSLQFPIHVLTLDDASGIIVGERMQKTDWITPLHWKAAGDPSHFEHWKELIRQKADYASETRQNFTLELDEWKRLQGTFLHFIDRFPAHYKHSLEQEVAALDRQEFRLDREWQEKQNALASYANETETNQNRIGNWDNEMNGITRNISSAQAYLEKEKQQRSHENALLHYQQELSRFTTDLKKSKRLLEEFKGEAEDCKEALHGKKANLDQDVLKHYLYELVKNEHPTTTSSSIALLAEAFDDARRKVDGIVRERTGLERSLTETEQQLKDAEEQIGILTYEYPGVEIEEEFPSNGAEQIKFLFDESRQLNRSWKDAQKLEDEKHVTVLKQLGAVEMKEKEVSNPVLFHQPLTIAERELGEDWTLFHIARKGASDDQQLAQKETARWYRIIRMLERKAGEHHCFAQNIQAALLSEKEQTDFTYHAEQMVEETLSALAKTGSAFADESKRIEKERTAYSDFCRSTITDSRLQQTAVQGIASRQTYDEVLEYKQLLEQRLQMAERYAEEHIQTHDKELELFLRHMATHVNALREELLLIPKKTSVKIEDSWRQIFRITVPEWQENEAKMLLRTHVNWILNQLERDTYQTDEGMDEVKTRQSLEKWLNSRQLLQVVLQNKPIRISCHKVTNDNRITRSAFTWEESNNWSGGEKWSKNMSLFLGLLNYVAEKKQHIQAHMKRHRTVILDNPFGKASSGHVLTPVFFIAEQLGFQVITLTAHAEGKFLSDFFPVVYSCRLRKVAGTSTQIMETEKTIHSAFLQDLEPASIKRLEQVEQMELFELQSE
ncbi:hypothetical protein HNO89_000159 [Sporosarcina luteola]|nr:hypothetical protein [Sporosarcina luteola]